MATDSIKTSKVEVFTDILSNIDSRITINEHRIERYGRVCVLLARLNVITAIPNWTVLFTLRSDYTPLSNILLVGTKGGTPYFITVDNSGNSRNYGQFPVGDYYTFFTTYIV